MNVYWTAWMALGVMGAGVQAPGALAQEEQEEQRQATAFRPDRWVELETLCDAEVRFLPTAGDVREAAEDGETADRPTGSVADILFEPSSGAMRWAVVSCGGFLGIGDKTVAVPMKSLEWNEEKECYDLRATREELERLSDFDLDGARTDGFTQSLKAVTASWNTVTEDDVSVDEGNRSQDQSEEVVLVHEDVRFTVASMPFFSAEDFRDLELFARHEEFGKVSRALVDRDQGRVQYVVVSHGGLAGIGDVELIVPYDELTLCRRAEVEDPEPSDCSLCIDASKQELENGVRYVEPEQGVLSEHTFRRLAEVYDGERG